MLTVNGWGESSGAGSSPAVQKFSEGNLRRKLAETKEEGAAARGALQPTLRIRRASVTVRRKSAKSVARKSCFISLATLIAANSAMADPCEGALPKKGSSFGGLVRYVGDGDSLCIGENSDPSTWIEVRIADFYAPELHDPGGREAKASLTHLAYGKEAKCFAGRRSYDRVVAECKIGGYSVAELMRRAGVKEGGRGR